MKILGFIIVGFLLMVGELQVDARILNGEGVEGRILVDEASEAEDGTGSGTESHRLFPEEGRPRNVDSPRHRR